MFNEIIEKRVAPPYCPDLFKFNFDENEFGKGEAEFLTRIRIL
jgi:serum/glucocorticoid-regulated kinase 2